MKYRGKTSFGEDGEILFAFRFMSSGSGFHIDGEEFDCKTEPYFDN